MIGKIIKKEVKELFKRSTLVSMILIAVMFGYLGKTMSAIGEDMKEKPKILIINEDTGLFTDILDKNLHSIADIQSAGADEFNSVSIKKGFSDSIRAGKQGILEIHYIMKGAGIMNSIKTEGFEGIIMSAAMEISDSLISGNYGFSPSVMRNPVKIERETSVKGKLFKNMSPGIIMSVLSTQVSTLPILIMMLIIMSGSTVISSMAFEKENKTLETLLTMPVKRSYIISGKIIGSAIVGLVFAGIYIMGFRYYMNSFSLNELSTASFSMNLNIQQMILLLLSFLASLLAGLSACMLLGAFTKDSKQSQTMILPVTISAMFSMFMTMFVDYSTMTPMLKIIYFIIPFSHPMMAFRELIFGNYIIVIAGIIYCFIFFFAMIGLTAYIFNSDILLIGNLPKLIKRK